MLWNRRGPRGQDRVRRGDGAALGRRHVLGREERERGQVRQRAHRAAAVARADRVRRVLQQQGPRGVGHGTQLVHLGRVAGVVDRRDDPGPGRQCRLGRLRVEVAGVLLHVGEHDVRAEQGGRRRGRHERQRRRDDVGPGAHARGGVGDVQRRRTAGGGDDGGGAGVVGEAALEGGDRRAGGEPVTAQHRGDGRDVVLVDRLAPVRQHRAHTSFSRILLISSGVNHWSLVSEV